MSARDLALLTLDEKRLPKWKSRALSLRAKRALSKGESDARDVALAENISIGVVKNLLLLQHLIVHYSNRSLKSIDPAVQKILAVALYQLRFLSRIPASAAVNEAVKQTQTIGLDRASGFVNAVLRNATREPNPELPPKSNAMEYARIVLSHPPELFERYQHLLGNEKAIELCVHDNEEPPAILRLAPGVSVNELVGDGVIFRTHEKKGMAVIEGAKASQFADWSSRSLAQLQDPTAAEVVKHLDLQPGQTIVDRCAGVGTKTIQMHEMLKGICQILAIDASADRIATLNTTLKKRGISGIRTARACVFAEIQDPVAEQFDRILVDAPCSNSGVLARRPEARYHQDDKSIQSLTQLQLSILRDSAPRLARGGKLIYSTCSIWREENEQVVQQFLSEQPSFKFLDSGFALPSIESEPEGYHDGGFFAVFQRA